MRGRVFLKKLKRQMRNSPRTEGKQVLLKSRKCRLAMTVNKGNNQQVCGDAIAQTLGAINQRGKQPHLHGSAWPSVSQ